MAFMASFDENVKNVRPQIETIAFASKSLRSSTKMKKVLEFILAFGNYMNSTKKGPCYGFRLQSLDSLTITKSSDKKQHILHYIADLVHTRYEEVLFNVSFISWKNIKVRFQKAFTKLFSIVIFNRYPELKNFDSELRFLEKAAQYSLENIMIDLKELEKGMDQTRKELDNRAKDKSKQNHMLQDFVTRAGELVAKLRQDGDAAQVDNDVEAISFWCLDIILVLVYILKRFQNCDIQRTYFNSRYSGVSLSGISDYPKYRVSLTGQILPDFGGLVIR